MTAEQVMSTEIPVHGNPKSWVIVNVYGGPGQDAAQVTFSLTGPSCNVHGITYLDAVGCRTLAQALIDAADHIDPAATCMAEFDPWLCTEPAGHTGPHRAGGATPHPWRDGVPTWTDEDDGAIPDADVRAEFERDLEAQR